MERAAPSEPDARDKYEIVLLRVTGDLKYDRMHTSALVTPGRHRHRPVAETEVEQPPAILLPALRSLRLARWKVARHTISVVSCLDSCQSGPP